ncbi:Haloacid dehalogenase protein [Pleurostoma richardsiae]|uniref:Haloacid dehalogenase protein n=1 Tax=Pleurostoma richardsiae TaxID=41990 RepID=A0AA38RV55_9PEZI|nr:Haloacid dehalogenase protein [Pleurostoma richardsiae]
MAPLVPRMHLFEIDDQPWFHPWFRGRVQAALTQAWCFKLPLLQSSSAAALASRILARELGSSVADYVVIDFCAGGGGPTPSIEAHLNSQIGAVSPSSPTTTSTTTTTSNGQQHNGAVNGNGAPPEPVRFVLTDLHPHVDDWAKAAAASPNISYEPLPVDASAAPPALIARYKKASSTSSPPGSGPGAHPPSKEKKLLRLFNLAFHHFPDPLARSILRDTVRTSDAFAVMELQGRDAASALTTLVFGLGIMLTAPWYAWRWRSPMTLFWAWVLPVLPFVLVFDGFVSALRTRTADEVEALLRTCGAEGAEEWEVRSGSERHLWPCGYVNWVIGVKKQR